MIKTMSRPEGKKISADIHVPSASPWFDGHFPGEPILPGVAQIGMVLDTIRLACNQELSVSSVRRVRFKRIIRPGDQLKIIAEPLIQEVGSYFFRILLQGETVCSGVMTVGNKTGGAKDGADVSGRDRPSVENGRMDAKKDCHKTRCRELKHT